MKKVLFIILIFLTTYNGVFAQSLGKMTLGCKRYDIPLSLPSGFNVNTTNTENQLTYTTKQGNENVSFYLENGVVHKITMHKFIDSGMDINRIKSKLEEVILSLYEAWGEPSYIGENIYWQFPTSKATLTYNVSTLQLDDPLRYSGHSSVTTYRCYMDIKLEKRTNIFE